jgi:hypothetical protein
MTEPRFRCGDSVVHRPSGEKCLVAYDDGDNLAWAGWPEGRASSADCDLVRACTDEQHVAAVRMWLDAGRPSGPDHRIHVIRRLYPDAVAAAIASGEETADAR